MIDQVQVQAMIRDSAASDEYHLRGLTFVPDVIYDIGANVGGVTLFAASLFPDAKIIAVEPEEENYQMLVEKTKHLPNVVSLKAALTTEEKVYRCPTSPGIGNWIFNSESSPTFVSDWVQCQVQSVTLDQLYGQYGGEQCILKVDCESGELMLFKHLPSKMVTYKMAYLAGEFHLWGRTHDILKAMMRDFLWWLYQLSMTHDVDVELRGGMAKVSATKRAIPNNKNSWEHVLKLQETDDQ